MFWSVSTISLSNYRATYKSIEIEYEAKRQTSTHTVCNKSSERLSALFTHYFILQASRQMLWTFAFSHVTPQN